MAAVEFEPHLQLYPYGLACMELKRMVIQHHGLLLYL
jgi:hypothetical protein